MCHNYICVTPLSPMSQNCHTYLTQCHTCSAIVTYCKTSFSLHSKIICFFNSFEVEILISFIVLNGLWKSMISAQGECESNQSIKGPSFIWLLYSESVKTWCTNSFIICHTGLDPMQTLLILRESGPRRVQLPIENLFIEGQIIFCKCCPVSVKNRLTRHTSSQT